MKLATQDRTYFGNTYSEKLATIRKYGFDGLEIGGDLLIRHFAEIRQAVKETGAAISSICGGYRGWISDPDPQKREITIRDIGEIMKYAAEIGATGVVSPAAFGVFSRKLPPFVPPRPEEEDRENLLDCLSRIDQLGKETGSVLLLEPLNRYEDHLLNRLEDAVRLIREGGFQAVKIMADFFHMQIEEADISMSIRQNARWIRHVHLADSNRLQPGAGHTDFKSAFRTLKETGFDGYMSIECEISGDPEPAHFEMVRYLKSCMEG